MKVSQVLRRCLPIAAATLVIVGGVSLCAQTVLYWEPAGTGTPLGGPGTWNLSSASWTTDAVNAQAWSSAGADELAVFGAPGDPSFFWSDTTNVTVSGALTAAGLRFDALTYSVNISGAGNALTLATNTGFAPRIDVTYPSVSATINGPLAGTSGVTFGGAGTISLAGNNTLTGGININGATVKLLSNTASLPSSNTLTMGATVADGGSIGGGGTFRFDNIGATGPTTQTLGAAHFVSGDSTVRTTWNGMAFLSLTFASQTRDLGATVNYYADVLAFGTNGTDSKINLTAQPTGFIDQGTFFYSTFDLDGGYAWKDSGGFLRAIKYGTDPGTATTGNATKITPGTNLHYQITGNVTQQDSITLKTLKIKGSSSPAVNPTLTLVNGATLTVSGLLKTGSTDEFTTNSGTITGGTAIRANLNEELIIRTDQPADMLTIATPIVANGTNPLVKSGPGTVVLNAANTYTGPTYINGGELRLTNSAALPSGSNVLLNGGVIGIGTGGPTAFTIGTGPGQIQWTGDGGFAAATAARSVTLNGGAPLTWGAGNFVPNGNRLLFASQLSNSTLTLTNDINLGSVLRTINVNFSRGPGLPAAAAALSGQLTGTGGIALTGGGSLSLPNANTYSGGTQLIDGTLILGNDAALGSGPLIFGGGSTGGLLMGNGARVIANNVIFLNTASVPLQIGGTSDLTFTGALSGSGTFSLTGSNNITFAGNSPNFTGYAQLQNIGKVIIASNNAFGTGLVQFYPNVLQGDGTPRTISNDGYLMPVTIGGASDLTFTGHLKNDYGGDPLITITNTGVTTFGAIDLADASVAHTVTFAVAGSSTAFITGPIVSGFNTTNSALTKSNPGTLTISSTANTYAGATMINGTSGTSGGVLAVMSLANGGVNSSIGKSTNAAANLVINFGTLRYIGSGGSTDRLFQIGNGTGSSGTLDASGAGAINFTNTGSIAYGSNNQTRTLTLTGTSTAANTLSPTINNNGSGVVSLTKTGPGTWVIANGGNYTGATTINGGLLVMNGSAVNSAVTVNDGGALGGTGSVGNVTVQSGGAVAPGNSPGTLSTKNFSLLSGGALKLEIGGLNAGQYDQLNITGTVSLAGDVQISLFGGYTPQIGDKFFVILNDSTDTITGTFANPTANQIIVSGTTFAVSYTDNSAGGGAGNDVSLTVVSVVPEPASTGLLLLGLAAFAARRRRGA